MAFSSRWPSAVTVLTCLLYLCNDIKAQNETEKLPNFGDTVQILGAMERTDPDFQDGLALDLFSPKNRTLIVKQNTSPLGAQFVTGTTGEPFVALSNYSYIIQMNETANDLIAKIEVPYDPGMLNAMGIQEANTYVATLASDKKSWVVDDSTRNVHRSENNTRIIKITSLDGEYLLVGRQTVDTSNIFVQYGQGATRTVNMTGGAGIQQAEFVDGLRFSIQAGKALTMNVDLKQGIDPTTLPANTQSLNSFMWIAWCKHQQQQQQQEPAGVSLPPHLGRNKLYNDIRADYITSITPQDIVKRRIRSTSLIAICHRGEVPRRYRLRATLPQPPLVKEESPDLEPFPLVCAKI
ncbi:uncharacterized protein PAC_14412 [Phialocephala subalpina]|uniref:Ricin B lectin domain-containing protein n=1 Tax=Phialocephala subalpina TaxID=576137 RepID=A0A1L7XHL0_9HELO|nr:uncharacterized protein PAC_14412 [Phialocephala subalpina]